MVHRLPEVDRRPEDSRPSAPLPKSVPWQETPLGVLAHLGALGPAGIWPGSTNSTKFSAFTLAHWYAWQVTVLGLGPVWLSSNEQARKEVATLLTTATSLASDFPNVSTVPTSTPRT